MDGAIDLEYAGSYELGLGCHPNPVLDAAIAYLDAADVLHEVEAKKIVWLNFKTWYVIHHLSVIATELFLKSFRVTVKHGPVTSPEGPDDVAYFHAFAGHKADLGAFQEDVVVSLKAHLPERLFNLMLTLSKQDISRGRYPYEEDSGMTRFPVGDDGRALAERWLDLARALSTFHGPPIRLGVPD